MEKTGYQNTSSISKAEYHLINKISESGIIVFGPGEIKKLLACNNQTAYQLVYTLNKKGIITKIIDGKYFLSLLSLQPDQLSIASHIVYPSYLSFWTALNFYQFTEQLPRTIFITTTRTKTPAMIDQTSLKFIKLSTYRFFGYTKKSDIIIADKEKAIIDSLLLPRYAGGIDEVYKCICNAWNEIDSSILIEYALRMGNSSLNKRLGYLIELGIGMGLLAMHPELMEKLRGNIGKGYSKLEPQAPKKGKCEKKWGLILNIDEKKLDEWNKII
jgi:predicted transcriptional regulator of viral defense system